MAGRIGSQEGAQRWSLKGDAETGLAALAKTLGSQFEVAGVTNGSAVVSTRSGLGLPEVDGWTVTSQPI